jgi:predicted metal-dependent enzyme (double-stranded beta helix superfamily)
MRIASATVLSVLALQSYPPPFPREGATKSFENDRVVVWEATFARGRPTPMHEHRLDAVGIFLSNGQIRTTPAGGPPRDGNPFSAGHVVYGTKGVIHIEESLVDGTRLVLIEFKDQQNTPKQADMPKAARPFPREGATLRLDNERVAIWDVQWVPGHTMTPHVHDRDVIIIPFQDGEVRYTGPDKETRVERLTGGKAVYQARGESHYGESSEGSLRTIHVELK